MREKIVRWNLFIGLAILIGATYILIQGNTFMKTWYYIFAWWSCILCLDSINFRRMGSSPLSENLSRFFFLAFLSISVWLTFELYNLRLQNWSYHALPTGRLERWLGYALAFATVMPALKELSLLFQHVRPIRKRRSFSVRVSASFLRTSLVLGIICLALPLIWPRHFFPLVWLAFIFLLEPINYWLGADTLLADMEKNKWNRLWSWLLAGLTAGVLWEFFNFWAGSHWEYSLPYLDFGRIFQMPVFGYLGFLPFALEIFAISSFLSRIQSQVRNKKGLWILFCILILFFCLAGFYLVDTFTVIPGL